ncbi:PepSY-associated TM helix domain-containing protein [Methylobacterium sp. NEAU 140]|uniref:PepSY-associated TM helix domain-containing protein n=1 Tax=Methylobacterium sp. NEAU 140 TaxID=3064945 RepID=UPI0027351978|nr:PepSY-associated TM helix domain-containing protein [Methylobacterium sp. NEAU 140]MDP4025656.1 PepSY-associated TM helix domain-containing protein [Methylobacterium sp. NEAU 140]
MKGTLRQSMAWLHAWSGLVVGWVLFAVFVTGTASYYRSEISQWMRPELRAGRSVDAARAADLAVAALRERAPEARTWFVTLPTAELPATQIAWRSRPGTPFSVALLDPEAGGPSAARDTRGGDFLYRFHFELHMPPLWGRWVVGACAMIMLIALLSGIVTHRRIFADFFTFRRRADQRGWLDAHNVVGVLALPFHLMITYTGLVTLMLLYMPWGVNAAYEGNRERFFQDRGQSIAARPPARAPGELAPLAPMVREAMRLTGSEAVFVAIHNPRDAASTVVVTMDEPEGIPHLHPSVGFDGTTGAALGTTGPASAATTTHATMLGLHEAHFAGPILRVLFFLSGLMGCAMVATGLVLWSVARMPKPNAKPSAEREATARMPLGHRLVHALNVGTVAGLPAALACYFLANRLLPASMPGRLDAEVQVFFAAWLLMALPALVVAPRRAWTGALAAAAALFLAVPVVGGATTGRHLAASLRDGDAAFIGFDLAMLCLALGFALTAHALGRRPVTRSAGRALPRDGMVGTPSR